VSASDIARLNDALRTTGIGGQIVITQGIAGLHPTVQAGITATVSIFSNFNADNDPHGEHDFGAFDFPGAGKVFWKIDYYDLTLTAGSENPADPSQTTRVLTIMLAHEY
jgi:hypothetical protein